MLNEEIKVREKLVSDYEWVVSLLQQNWGSKKIVTRGQKYDASQLPAFLAVEGEKPVGLITYHINNANCEIVTLDSVVEGKGVGTMLIDIVKKEAASKNCKRLWLITTNDNLNALRFYQKQGFQLVAVYPNAIEQSRKLKPEIPLIGMDNIPLRDEIEVELPI